jgi:hypothetical protein
VNEPYVCLCCGERADDDRDFILGRRPRTGCCWKCVLGNPDCAVCIAEGLPGDVAVRLVPEEEGMFRPGMQ